MVSNDEWFDRLTDFLKETSELIEAKVKAQDRSDYGEQIIRALNDLANFTYLVRRERDQALAAGYIKYPKGDYNSDASTALARQHASEEVRLRSLLKEIEVALKMRFELNRSDMVTDREVMKNA